MRAFRVPCLGRWYVSRDWLGRGAQEIQGKGLQQGEEGVRVRARSTCVVFQMLEKELMVV